MGLRVIKYGETVLLTYMILYIINMILMVVLLVHRKKLRKWC